MGRFMSVNCLDAVNGHAPMHPPTPWHPCCLPLHCPRYRHCDVLCAVASCRCSPCALRLGLMLWLCTHTTLYTPQSAAVCTHWCTVCYQSTMLFVWTRPQVEFLLTGLFGRTCKALGNAKDVEVLKVEVSHLRGLLQDQLLAVSQNLEGEGVRV